MKRILITGKNSYIGNSFEQWVNQWPEKYQIDKVSLRSDNWKDSDWSMYDSVFHVAGIAHNSSDSSLEELYYTVNRDLTNAVALKAKHNAVKQFVFMSSIIVFGTKNEKISKNTVPNPDNFYGDSKLQAEKKLELLNDDNFKVAIVRPPMIYGKNSKGNYPLLSKLAQKTPVFPDYDNIRSMLHVDNLTELIRLIIESYGEGYYHPQNPEYVKTSDMVKIIAKLHNHRIWTTKAINWGINLLRNINLVNKVFGDLYYDQNLSNMINLKYHVNSLEQSINKTEK